MSKIKTMIVSRSPTVHPQLTPLIPDGTVLKETADLDIFWGNLYARMTFEKHLHSSVSSAAAQRLGTMRKSWQVFHDRSLLRRSFWSVSCRFWSIARQGGAQLPTHTLNYWTEFSGVLVF